MATTNLNIKSKSSNANIYLRFTNGRAMNLERPIGVFVDAKNWNAKQQKIKDVISVPNRDEINSKLAKLKIFVVDQYNVDYMNRVVINGDWLSDTVKKFFGRPAGEVKGKNKDSDIYLTDFATHWLTVHAPNWKVSASKYMDEATKGNYKILNDIIIDFQGKRKIMLKDIDTALMDRFSEYLADKGYATITAKRMISRFKFFCARAEEFNLDVNKNYKQRVYVAKEAEDYKHPYLNEQEIDALFKKDLSFDPTLDNVRDLFVIGLWTGLRISDFNGRLDISKFRDGYIEIKTAKTATMVTLPVHKHIKAILQKRNGELPKKISDQKFNKHIKTICQILEFDEEIPGAIVKVDEKTKEKRKEFGMYKKYLLVTSHICRRSFCTNLYGKVPNRVIMDLAGWASEAQMTAYNKATKRESADVLKEYWETK